jgi:sterol desaturase/sphingolipid hydroxylase (fatty acid hydroxylase superfamily)
MLALLLTILVSFLVSALFGYSAHWLLHQKIAGPFNKAHIEHHEILYPHDDYQSDVYRATSKNSAPIFFAIMGIPLILTPIALYYFRLLPWYLALISLVAMVIFGFLSNYLHDSFHIRNHWLNYIPIIKTPFKKWVLLHWIHHFDQRSNFGIFCFWFDRIFGTFRSMKD